MTILDDHHNIVYFGMRRTPDNTGLMGAALAIDCQGIPVEFRCSAPIRPTALQQALYGHLIHHHIAIDLCGRPLLHSLESEPAVCLVEAVSLFDLQQDLSLPVFHVERANESHRAGRFHQDGNRSSVGGAENVVRIDSVTGLGPILLKCNPHWHPPVEEYIRLLERISANCDLMEPFDRLTAACQLTCQEDPRFR